MAWINEQFLATHLSSSLCKTLESVTVAMISLIERKHRRRCKSYDTALAETISDLFRAEVIYRREPWRSLDTVE